MDQEHIRALIPLASVRWQVVFLVEILGVYIRVSVKHLSILDSLWSLRFMRLLPKRISVVTANSKKYKNSIYFSWRHFIFASSWQQRCLQRATVCPFAWPPLYTELKWCIIRSNYTGSNYSSQWTACNVKAKYGVISEHFGSGSAKTTKILRPSHILIT